MSSIPSNPAAKTLSELCSSVAGAQIVGRSGNSVSIQSLALDSRCVTPGALFFALSGSKFDGNAFAKDAISRGARAIVSADASVSLNVSVPVMVVPSVASALAQITKEFFDNPTAKLKAFGVTGTNGKTTVAWILSEAMQALGSSACYVGTLGYRNLGTGQSWDSPTTTPNVLDFTDFVFQRVNEGVQAVACEVSSHGIEQRRLDGVEWDVAVFTNITRDHLDFHETFENYQQAKLKLFTEGLVSSTKKTKCACINIDDPFGAKIISALAAWPEIRVATYSMSQKADCYAVTWNGTAQQTAIKANVFGEVLDLRSNLVGSYNVHNILAALPALKVLGYSAAEISAAIAKIPFVPGRLELVKNDRVPVFIDYAHTPDGLINVQRSLRPLTEGRLITVFGCGGDRDRGKRPLMGQAVAELSDYAVVTSDNPRSENPDEIIAEILPGIEQGLRRKNFRWEKVTDRARAIRVAIGKSRPGDVVLVAGKGHETYQEIQGVRHPFSDREQCVAAVNELATIGTE